MSADLRSLASAPLVVAGVLALAPPVSAGTLYRTDLIQPYGACVGSQPTDPLRHRAGGFRNTGAAALYVVCSTYGDPGNTGLNVTQHFVSIRVRNTGAATVNAQCTLHAGRSTSSTATAQGSSTKVQSIGSGQTHWFDFGPADLPGANGHIANPTFVCKLDPKVEVMYLYGDYYEEVGA